MLTPYPAARSDAALLDMLLHLLAYGRSDVLYGRREMIAGSNPGVRGPARPSFSVVHRQRRLGNAASPPRGNSVYGVAAARRESRHRSRVAADGHSTITLTAAPTVTCSAASARTRVGRSLW
ncbi:MAG: hypothetical protein NVSMB55_01160 [Mycobacteriales bacterium]